MKSIQRRRSLLLLVLLVVALAGFALAGCGGGSSDEEIAEAEKRGAAKQAQRERLRDLEKGLKNLRRGGQAGGSGSAPPNPSSSAPAPTTSNCGGGTSVNSVTTCPFAENVRYAYEAEIGAGSGTVAAYSPARDITYQMYCTAGSPHECTGGDNAAVYFP